MLNSVVIMGRICKDIELKTTPTGVSVTSFCVAVERDFVKQGEERKTDFIEVVVWRQAAEFVSRYFHKGSLIAVQGSLQTRQYEDKNGNKRTAYEVIASNVSFCGRDEKKSAEQAEQNEEVEPITDDEPLPF